MPDDVRQMVGDIAAWTVTAAVLVVAGVVGWSVFGWLADLATFAGGCIGL